MIEERERSTWSYAEARSLLPAILLPDSPYRGTVPGTRPEHRAGFRPAGGGPQQGPGRKPAEGFALSDRERAPMFWAGASRTGAEGLNLKLSPLQTTSSLERTLRVQIMY